ncbi:MAG: DUF1801 domain-containing protein [Pseudomonadota bacterium]|nr:DUF1801 domain-containing protein [Pseudomonadota bacterium]
MTSDAMTVEAYLAGLPADRREALEAVRAEVNRNLPEGVVEGMQYGMIGWYVPHSRYPHGYHCDPKQPLPFASLASQKAHMAVYLFCAYVDGDSAAWIQAEAARRGCKLDMGKSCVRFKKLSDLPLDLIGQAIARSSNFVEKYEAALPPSVRKKRKT